MIKKCCFNCSRCFPAPDNEFECRSITGEVLKGMDSTSVLEECCDEFSCNSNGADSDSGLTDDCFACKNCEYLDECEANEDNEDYVKACEGIPDNW